MNNIHTKERGASMVEYALLIVLIALISLPAVGMVGDRTEKTMTTVAEALEQTDGGPVSGAPGDADESGDPGAPGDPGDPGDPGNTGNPGGNGDPGGNGHPGDPRNPGDPGNPGGGNGGGGNGGNRPDPGNGGQPDPEPGPQNPTDQLTVGEPTAKKDKNHWIAQLPITNVGTEPITIVVRVVGERRNGNESNSQTETITLQPGQTWELESDKLPNAPGNPVVSARIEITVLGPDGKPLADGSLEPVTVSRP